MKPKAIWHSDRIVYVKGYDNFFEKKWDKLKNQDYILIDGKKYYLDYPLKLCERSKNETEI